MTATYYERIASKAIAFPSPARMLLSVLAAPFYVIGWVLGVLWALVYWAWAAVLVGLGDAGRMRNRRPVPPEQT